MGLPSAEEARIYYRAASQRFEDATILLLGKRTTGAMYMAGYSVECVLKALILSAVPGKARQRLLAEFCGMKAHNFEWLKNMYVAYGGGWPAGIARPFTQVNREWSPQWRYDSGARSEREAKAFLEATQQIIHWADGRL